MLGGDAADATVGLGMDEDGLKEAKDKAAAIVEEELAREKEVRERELRKLAAAAEGDEQEEAWVWAVVGEALGEMGNASFAVGEGAGGFRGVGEGKGVAGNAVDGEGQSGIRQRELLRQTRDFNMACFLAAEARCLFCHKHLCVCMCVEVRFAVVLVRLCVYVCGGDEALIRWRSQSLVRRTPILYRI